MTARRQSTARRKKLVAEKSKTAAQLDHEIAQALATSAYFKTGDVVLMGKYKNKRGTIVGFSGDKWGNPTVEIEPTPRGRKQNRIVGLYKMWRADVKEGVLKKQAERASRGRRKG